MRYTDHHTSSILVAWKKVKLLELIERTCMHKVVCETLQQSSTLKCDLVFDLYTSCLCQPTDTFKGLEKLCHKKHFQLCVLSNVCLCDYDAFKYLQKFTISFQINFQICFPSCYLQTVLFCSVKNMNLIIIILC